MVRTSLAWEDSLIEVGLNIKVVGKGVNDLVQLESFSLDISVKSYVIYHKMTIFGLLYDLIKF